MSRWIDFDFVKSKKRFDKGKMKFIVWMQDIYHAPSIDLVRCAECRYLAVQNTKYLYAICHRHGIEFKPFKDDTRTHGCSWGERKESE